MKKSILKKLSIFAALFLCITGLIIAAASAPKCPYCGKNAKVLKCPVCGYTVDEHEHVTGTGTTGEGETTYYNLVRAQCPSCTYVWFEEVN